MIFHSATGCSLSIISGSAADSSASPAYRTVQVFQRDDFKLIYYCGCAAAKATMTKSSKSNATIRRRKNKPTADFLSKLRKSHPNKPDLASATQEENEEEMFFYKEVLQSSVIEKIMSSDKTIFLGLLVIRLVNAMLIQTWFVPDEFWQSVEVAHKMIFEYPFQIVECINCSIVFRCQ